MQRLMWYLFFTVSLVSYGWYSPAARAAVRDDGSPVEQPYTIFLKSRTFTATPGISEETLRKIVDSPFPEMHVFLQFWRSPAAHELQLLHDLGVTLVDPVPNLVFFAAVPTSAAVVQQLLALHDLVRWIGEIVPGDKIAPAIQAGVGAHARNLDGTVNLTVVFFANVAIAEARQVIARHGGQTTGEAPILKYLRVRIPEHAIPQLAEEDTVEWINQVPPPPELLNDGLRDSILADHAQAPPLSLTGTGVVVGEWDGGWADKNHPDFSGRVTQKTLDPSKSAYIGSHATHVAGIIVGDGTNSGGQYRGVAPKAALFSYDMWQDAIEAEPNYKMAISDDKIDLSSNSWYVPGEKTGGYEDVTKAVDHAVRGDFGKPLSIIWAAGNRNQGCTKEPYACLLQPGTAKNVIEVGATNSDDASIATFSSWGPTEDGRVKPDVVAPGCEERALLCSEKPPPEKLVPCNSIWSTLPCMSGICGYRGDCGTSMATPAVSGTVALMLEQWRKTHSGMLDPRPATMKAVLIETAHKPGPFGPDYAFGYGLIDAFHAVELIRTSPLLPPGTTGSSSGIIEGQLDPTSSDSIPVRVEFCLDLVSCPLLILKVTLVWDDVPCASACGKTLVNDLDLVVVAPDGTQYYPWVLNPAMPAAAATRAVVPPDPPAPDRLNNVEQVTARVDNMPGIWTIQVTPSTIMDGSQKYSVVFDTLVSRVPPPPLGFE